MQLIAQNLTGRFVQLEPIQEAHREGLRAAANDPEIWTFLSIIAYGAHFDSWFDWTRRMHEDGAHLVFAVRRLADSALLGSTRYLEIVPVHKRAEIGFTWYAKDAQGGPVNPECKLHLLRHAFDAGANRVELKTDARNARSRAAIAKLGAKQEGVLRARMVMPDGYLRDDVYFSILRGEWPDVRAGLEARLADY